MENMPYIIYAVLECLVKRIERCENNPEISSTTKVGQHTPCGYSMLTVWGFNHMKNKYTSYREKDCMKKFCKFLRERAIRIIGFQKKKMLLLTNRELKSYEEAKICYICRRYFIKKLFREKNFRKVNNHCHYSGKYRGPVPGICNLNFNVPNEIPVVFHNNSKYDYHFIIKNWQMSLKDFLNVLGKTMKYIKVFLYQ